jgi:WD40 repeat protein
MVALSPDKTKVIAIWWWKPETTLFDLATRRRLWTRKESLPFPEFHPDNKRLLCRKGFDLFLLDIRSGATITKGSIYGAIEDIGTIAFSPFGYQIAVGDLRQSAFIFGTTTLEAQDSYDFEALVNTVCFLPDSKRVLIGGRKSQIDVLDPASRNFVESWEAEMKIVQDIFLTKDGKTLVIVGFRTKSTGRDADAVADIWDLKTFLPK